LWLPVAVMAEWELKFPLRNQRLQLQFLSSWWWVVCRSKCIEQLRNTAIINSITRSHLVGYFYTIYCCQLTRTSLTLIALRSLHNFCWRTLSVNEQIYSFGNKLYQKKHLTSITWTRLKIHTVLWFIDQNWTPIGYFYIQLRHWSYSRKIDSAIQT